MPRYNYDIWRVADRCGLEYAAVSGCNNSQKTSSITLGTSVRIARLPLQQTPRSMAAHNTEIQVPWSHRTRSNRTMISSGRNQTALPPPYQRTDGKVQITTDTEQSALSSWIAKQALQQTSRSMGAFHCEKTSMLDLSEINDLILPCSRHIHNSNSHNAMAA